MDVNSFLHAMPEVAQEEIVRRGVNSVSIGDGVNRMAIAGHDHGVAYFFKTDDIYNPAASNELGYEVFETLEQCYRISDRKNITPMPIKLTKHTGEVHFYPVPKELLAFNRLGECIGGLYKESYLNWKAGKNQPGFALRKWEVLSDSEISSLEAEGIFTIEQYASYPRDRIAGRFPQSFVEAHVRAVQWVAGKEMRAHAAEQVAKTTELEAKNKDLMERLARLEEQLAGQAKEKKVVKNKLLED